METLVREFRVGDLEDAGRLAAMWNASDAEWPGGWTHGVPETAERTLDDMRKLDRMAILVVEKEGEIVGYCDLRQELGRDGVAYVPLLNVRPDLHGQGLGKALLLAVLDRIVARGFQQLTLGTWAGNLKAVPLYKKTGFFWVPETTVWMQNYIPTALGMPAGRSFFAAHDWYRSFCRELQVAPDEVEWNGIKVFPYRFDAEGDLFAFWIDRQAEAPTAVETNDFLVECVVGQEEVVCGLEHPLRWQVTNKRGSMGPPLQVTLIAEGEEGIALKVVEGFRVEDRAVIERLLTIAPEAKRKEPGLPAHQIHSTLLIDGVPVRLGTAVKPVQAVEIQYDGGQLVPGKPEQKVVVRLKSNLDFPVRGELIVGPRPGLCFDAPKAAFTLQPRSWTSCTFHVDVQGSGAMATQMRVVCSPLEGAAAPADLVLSTKPKEVTFRTLPLDTPYTWLSDEGEMLNVATPLLGVYVRLRGGDITVCEQESGRFLARVSAPALGPPFTGGRRVPVLYPHRVETKDGKVSVTLSFPFERVAGVAVEQTITIGAGDILRIDRTLANGSDSAQRLKLRSETHGGLRGRITVPRRDGIVHEPAEGWGEYPMEGDLPRKPEEYAENWFAVEDSRLVTGLVWGECRECDQMTLQFGIPEVAAGAHHTLASVYLVAGRGNWERIRRLWRSLYQPGRVYEERQPVVSPVLTAALEPAPLLITSPETRATLAVRSRRGKELSGEVAIAAEGLGVTPDRAVITGVNSGSPFTRDVVVSVAEPAPRVAKAVVRLSDDITTRELPAPIVVLGDAGRPVSLSSPDEATGGVFAVENGCLGLKVAPGFLGSLVSLARGGTEFLQSAYPEAGPHSWMNPWFGGIHPLLNWPGEQRFVRETFAGAPVRRSGARGIPWQGIGAGLSLTHKEYRWLRMEMEYLTVGGSNVVAVVQRLSNLTDAPQGAWTGICVWAGVGGSPAGNVVHYRQNQPRYEQAGTTDEEERVARHRRRGPYSAGIPCGRWAAVEQAETGDTMALVTSHPDVSIEVMDEGREGVLLQAGLWASLEPGQSREFVHWLVVTQSVEEAGGYAVLGEVCLLP